MHGMKHLIALLFLLPCFSWAQVYVGGGFGYGENGRSTASQLNSATFQSIQEIRSSTYTVFSGVRYGSFGVESGIIQLPKYRGSANTSDYPAYKGLPPGTYPQTASATQAIDSTAIYARANFYIPTPFVTTYVFTGAAMTYTHNVEQALYNGAERATNDIRFWSKSPRPLYGMGVIAGHMRVEYVHIDGAIDNQHTNRRDVRMVNVSYVHQF